MIDAVRGRGLLMNGDDGFGDVVRGHDVDSIVGTQRKNREAGQDVEGLHHVELRSFGAAAVAHYDRGTEDGARHVGQQLVHHVLAEFLGACVGIVVGAGPVDRGVFGDDLVLALAGYGDGGYVRIAQDTVAILRAAGQLDYFQAAAEIDVEALLFGFAVQRGGAMNQRVGGVDQRVIVVVGEPETVGRELAAKYSDAGVEIVEKFGEGEMELQ